MPALTYGLAAVVVVPVFALFVYIFVPYTKVLGRVVFLTKPRVRSAEAFPPEQEAENAYRSYFFGPAAIDVRAVTKKGLPAMMGAAKRVYVHAGHQLNAHYSNSSGRFGATVKWVPVMVVNTFAAGLALLVGGLLGGLAAGAILLAQLFARGGGVVLRWLDTALLRAKGLDGMLCPTCYHRVAYPSYRCSGCGHLHSDIRPGPHGVIARRCACDTTMRTLIILGSHRHAAVCTHCGEPMSEAVGRSRELVLPLIGGVSAGKTQLMAAMVKGLMDDQGRSTRLADDPSRRNYQVVTEVFANSTVFPKTGDDLPRAQTLHTGSGRARRLVHLFDTNGERFSDLARIDELEYVVHARTFLFVVDVQAVPQFWKELAPEERNRLDQATASEDPPEAVFDRTVQSLIGLEVPLRQCRLIVALSKVDVFEGLELMSGYRGGNAWARGWLTKRLELGNLVRSMRDTFGKVDYVFTSSVPDDLGRVPASVRTLTRYCLEGRRPRRFAVPLHAIQRGRTSHAAAPDAV